MEQPQQRRTLFEPEPATAVPAAPATVVPSTVVSAPPPPVVERELPPPADVAEYVEPERARFNPWLAVLWVIGLVCVAVGILINWNLYEQSTISSDLGENFYLFISVTQTFVPWFFGVGLAAIVSAVAIHALDWQRRRA